MQHWAPQLVIGKNSNFAISLLLVANCTWQFKLPGFAHPLLHFVLADNPVSHLLMWLIRIIPDFAHLTGSVCIHIYHYTYVGITVGHCFISLPIYLPNGQSNVNIRNLVYYTRATAPVVITGWTPVGIMAIFAPIWPTRFFP